MFRFITRGWFLLLLIKLRWITFGLSEWRFLKALLPSKFIHRLLSFQNFGIPFLVKTLYQDAGKIRKRTWNISTQIRLSRRCSSRRDPSTNSIIEGRAAVAKIFKNCLHIEYLLHRVILGCSDRSRYMARIPPLILYKVVVLYLWLRSNISTFFCMHFENSLYSCSSFLGCLNLYFHCFLPLARIAQQMSVQMHLHVLLGMCVFEDRNQHFVYVSTKLEALVSFAPIYH